VAKNKNTKPKQDLKEKADFKNPANTIWGKVIIWIILFSMVGAVIFALVLALINM